MRWVGDPPPLPPAAGSRSARSGCPEHDGQKGPKMKLRNTTATTTSQESRDEAILQNLTLVNKLARRLQSRVPPCVTFDDLTSAGTIGLIEAVQRFDPSRGMKLRSYAQHRIWG